VDVTGSGRGGGRGRRRGMIALLVWAALATSLDGRLTAQDTVAPRFPTAVETAASHLFNATMSPFCPGLLLANCPSPQAGMLRDTIRTWLAAGVPADSIRAMLLAAYGEQVRAAPRAGGFGLLAWVVPGVALVAGALGVAWWLRRVTRRRAPPTAPPGPLDRATAARLERELSQL
jgi:cytochrome c-type biogenesis protein CcmH/NrfF